MDMTWFDELEAKIPKGNVRTRFAPVAHRIHARGQSPHRLVHLAHRPESRRPIHLPPGGHRPDSAGGGATELIYRTMAECGLTHDEGPDVGGPVGPYIQTQRRGLYGKFAELLVEKGHAYYCFCEKAESEEDSGDFDRAGGPLPLPVPAGRSRPSWPPASPMSSGRKSPYRDHHLLRRLLWGDHRGKQHLGRPGSDEAGRPAHL